MSVQLERSESQAIHATHPAALAPSGAPVSVTCWVYLDAQPGEGETHTIWWWGDYGSNAQHLKLVAIAGASGVLFRAHLQHGNDSIAATTTISYPLDTWHYVSVVLEAIAGDKYRIKLYVDEDAAVSVEETPQGANFSLYEVFAIGRSSGLHPGRLRPQAR